jgi:hypothetical protein
LECVQRSLNKYIEDLIHTTYKVPEKAELSRARQQICDEICREFENVLPTWPQSVLNGKVTKSFELRHSNCYQFQKRWIAWQAVGWMEVSVDPCAFRYDCSVSGDPEVKLVMVDMLQVEEFERLCITQGFENVRKKIREKAVKDKVIKSIDPLGVFD